MAKGNVWRSEQQEGDGKIKQGKEKGREHRTFAAPEYRS
jgi:hypothetical protein